MNEPRKILYVHIPKAGGSAVNAFFEERLGKSNCLPHAENVLRKANPDKGKIRAYRFVSAHLVYPNLRKQVDDADRLLMTVLRNPMDQLVSHIAWMRFQTEPEQARAFSGLPDRVKAISERLTGFDPSNADALERFLSDLEAHEMGFFDNCQTRYLLPQVNGVVAPGLLPRAKRNLAALDFVGVCEEMQDVFDVLSYRFGLAPSKDQPRVNESRRKYGLDPADPAVREVLRPYVALDEELYRLARRLFAAEVYETWSGARAVEPRVFNRELLHKLITRRQQGNR